MRTSVFSSLMMLVGMLPMALVLLVASAQPAEAMMFGLGWAADNRWAKSVLGQQKRLQWFHHWQMGDVPQLSNAGLEYVPTLWGPRYYNQWYNQIKPSFKNKPPKNILGINEPDVPSQGNMSPEAAADLYMREIFPLKAKYGTRLGSPQLCWKIDWMDAFLKALHKRGGHVDFIALHSYQSWKDLAKLKKFVSTAHARWGKPIWITEYGITTSSWPSAAQAQNYLIQATTWLEAQGYVERVAWFGAWSVSTPPDGYASKMNALFDNQGQLRSQGRWYALGGSWGRRSRVEGGAEDESLSQLSRRRHHQHLARELGEGEKKAAVEGADVEDEVEHPDAVHCDERCQALEKALSELKPFSLDDDE